MTATDSNIVRVLIVDDAPLMRKAISRILSEREDIEVVGMAANGMECLQMIEELAPDVVTLDIDMPVMNGITTVKNIMVRHHIPTVIVSSMVQDGYFAFEALRLGVMDFLPKPSKTMGGDWASEEEILCRRVRLAASMQINRMRRVRRKAFSPTHSDSALPAHGGPSAPSSLVLMGTTLAGPNSIMHVVTQLSSGITGSVVALQEIHPRILPPFCEHFNRMSPLEVVPVTESCALAPGKVYMCSTFSDVAIVPSEEKPGEFMLSVNEATHHPIDLLFQSAAHSFGDRACGVILTGIGRDGSEGLRAIREAGGLTVAQKQECCVYPNIVENAIQADVVEMVLPLGEIPRHLRSWLDR
ncbi:MAG: chemotaxis protein CheB [Acidobacteriota bacterium]